jgi:hypothetical protein
VQRGGEVGAVLAVLGEGGDQAGGLFDAVVGAAGGVRADRGERVAEQHRVPGADRPDHRGGRVDVHHRYRRPGDGGRHEGGLVGGQVRGGVGVDVRAGGRADMPGLGEDPAGGWGAELRGVAARGGVEVERPVHAAGHRGEVELHPRSGFEAQEVDQSGQSGPVAAVRDVPGVAQRPARVEQPPPGRGAAVGEHDQVDALGAAVGEAQHRPAAVPAQAGDPRPGVQYPGGQPATQRGVQQRPGGEPARVGPPHRLGGPPVAHGDLRDGLGGVLDELVLVDAEPVQDVQRRMLQRDQPTAQGGGRGGGLVHGDPVEAGLQQQQRGDRAGQRTAHDGDAAWPGNAGTTGQAGGWCGERTLIVLTHHGFPSWAWRARGNPGTGSPAGPGVRAATVSGGRATAKGCGKRDAQQRRLTADAADRVPGFESGVGG